jgi:predicted AAA+ superfamily ATPase
MNSRGFPREFIVFSKKHRSTMLVERTLKQTIQESLVNSNKIILIFGLRQAGKTAKMSKAWGETYPEASFEVVNRENYLDWVG